jgi:hypothetical protein
MTGKPDSPLNALIELAALVSPSRCTLVDTNGVNQAGVNLGEGGNYEGKIHTIVVLADNTTFSDIQESPATGPSTRDDLSGAPSFPKGAVITSSIGFTLVQIGNGAALVYFMAD